MEKLSNPKLELFFYKHKHNGEFYLVPLYGNRLDDDVWIVNLTNIDNMRLLNDIPINYEKPCLLVHIHTGLLIAQDISKQGLNNYWFSEGKIKLKNFKEQHEKKYIELCTDYYDRLSQINKKYGEPDECQMD